MRTIWDYLRYLIGVVAGWTVNPETHFIRADETVSIRCNVPLPFQADGDIIGTTPVDVAVLPGALTVLVSGTSANEEQSVSPQSSVRRVSFVSRAWDGATIRAFPVGRVLPHRTIPALLAPWLRFSFKKL